MRVYLAGRYSRRLELCRYREQLHAIGVMVTSRWLAGEHEMIDGRSGVAELQDRARFAQEDIVDLLAADVVIAFTEPAHSGPARGGRHVELGYALATQKRVCIVGFRENVFCCLPCVEFHPDWESLRETLRREVRAAARVVWEGCHPALEAVDA